MATFILKPFSGSPVGCNLDWASLTSPCSIGRLIICFTSGLGSNWRIHVNFAGRGYSAPIDNLLCGYTADSYVTFSSAWNQAEIDVWKAYQDGIWTSSTTVLVRIASLSGGSGGTIGVGREKYNASGSLPTSDPNYVSKGSITPDFSSCTFNLKATVTLNDDGTFSIA